MMNFTWGHVFLLAEKMFSLSDEQLAERLKTSRYTVRRHRSGKNSRFEPQTDVYKAVFAPPEKDAKALKEYFNKLIVALNSDAFPPDFRKPKYEDYGRSVHYLLSMATETGKTAKQNRPLQTVDANYTVSNARNQMRTHLIEPSMQQYWQIEDLLPMSVNPFHLDSDSNVKKTLSHPRYWRDDFKKQFDTYGVDFGDLNPQLKSVWESVRIIDEFFQCYEHYMVADFVAIDALDFGYRVGAAAVGTVTDGLDYILRTLKFIEHMETAIDYVPYDDETEEIHDNIAKYVTTLRKYTDFLRKHSTNSNLLGNTFFLVPDEYDNKKELEGRSKKFREDLQSQYENIKRKKEDERQEDKGDLQG